MYFVHLVKLLASNTYAFKNLKMDPLSAVEKMRSLLGKCCTEKCIKTSDSNKPMSSLLVEECITHLIQSHNKGRRPQKFLNHFIILSTKFLWRFCGLFGGELAGYI